MRQLKMIFLLTGLALMCCPRAWAVTDYAKLESKASRFVDFGEWGSALAMYELMMDQRPRVIPTYSRAITMAGLLNDEKTQVDFLERTQKHGIPLDSIFSQVKDFSFSIGESPVYRKFLELVKIQQPWIARKIDIQLLDYYVFRNNGVEMVRQGERLLESTPDNIEYLMEVARGYVLQGRYDAGMDCYKRILEIDYNNYDAMLALGNYGYIEAQKSGRTADVNRALRYLERAYREIPTPYVAKMMDELRRKAAGI